MTEARPSETVARAGHTPDVIVIGRGKPRALLPGPGHQLPSGRRTPRALTSSRPADGATRAQLLFRENGVKAGVEG
jgi:hypothetical protein